MHFHSTASDGKSTTEEILIEATIKNLEFLALTDHDTVSNWFAEEAKQYWINSCQSVEISAKNIHHNKSLHITFYANQIWEQVNQILTNIVRTRRELIVKQIEKLQNFGFNIDINDFYSHFEKNWRNIETLNKHDIVKYIFISDRNVLLAYTYYSWAIDIDTFYKEFLKRWGMFFDKFWYVIKDYEPTLEQCNNFKEESSWILSIAHPNFTFERWWIDEFIKVLPNYIEQWINAIEINSMATQKWVEVIIEQSKYYDLFLTFWSDNHSVWYTDSKHWDLWVLNPYLTKDFIQKEFNKYKDRLL